MFIKIKLLPDNMIYVHWRMSDYSTCESVLEIEDGIEMIKILVRGK
jgi:hypothetical protein